MAVVALSAHVSDASEEGECARPGFLGNAEILRDLKRDGAAALLALKGLGP